MPNRRPQPQHQHRRSIIWEKGRDININARRYVTTSVVFSVARSGRVALRAKTRAPQPQPTTHQRGQPHR